MNTKEIKNAVKTSLQMTRAPRSLDILYVFLHTYRLSEFRDSTEGFSIISTKILQQNFGLNSQKYSKYFNAWAVMTDEHSFVDGKARRITAWTANFIKLAALLQDVQVPLDVKEKYYMSFEPFTVSESEVLEERTHTLSGASRSLSEASRIIGGYKSTEASPFRKYCPQQAIPREDKVIIYEGKYDVDLNAAFGAIAWNVLDMKNCTLKNSNLLNPENKRELRALIGKEYGLSMDCADCMKKAKRISQYLFQGNTRVTMKCDWLNALHKEINNRVVASYEGLIDTSHKYFTYHEQKIVLTFAKDNNLDVVLNMLDGVISNNMPVRVVSTYLGDQYSFSVDQYSFSRKEAYEETMICSSHRAQRRCDDNL